MSKIRIFLLLLIGVPMIGFAQFSNSQSYFEGYVYNAENREPIPFVTIQVKGWSKGVVTNRDGSFKIPKKLAELNDTLVVSSIGYDTEIFLLGRMIAEESNNIFLKPHVYELDEAIVYGRREKKLGPKGIVRRAIRSISKNYPNQPFSLTGYYRDYQWYKNDYLNLNEAIISIYDQGFETKDSQSTKFALYTAVVNQNFSRDTISSKPYDYENGSKIIDRAHLKAYGGNELRILRIHDAIRNHEISTYSFVYNLKSQFLNSHSFERGQDIFLDNIPFYNIPFSKIENGYVAHGHLVIHKENFSIYKLGYSLFFQEYDTKSNKSMDQVKKELIFEVESEYRPLNDKMFLNYITFNNSFLLPEPPLFFPEELQVELIQQRLSLKFNNQVDQRSARVLTNYELDFLGERLPIKEISVDSLVPNTIHIYPLFENEKKQVDFYMHLANYEGDSPEEILDCDVKNITDTNGNVVNKIYTYKEYQQFREFFTQEVSEEFEIPNPDFLMNMNGPIFQGQSLQVKDDIENYWMNTPLKAVDD